MRVQPLGAGQRHRVAADPAEAVGVAGEDGVRFMKSVTPRPDEKRALRAVGSTWLSPAT